MKPLVLSFLFALVLPAEFPAAHPPVAQEPATASRAVESATPTDLDGLATVLEGRVLTSEGLPASEVLVTCSAGGQTKTDAGGRFRLEQELPPGVQRVELSAFQGSGSTLASSRLVVTLDASGRPLSPLVPTLTLTAGCQPSWVPTFGEIPGIEGTPAPDPLAVFALAVFDDGQGNGAELYLGGNFTRSGGVVRSYLARWDGVRWELVGGGVNDTVLSLEVFDDGQGGGPALFVGGSFTLAGGVPVSRIAKWDGIAWTPLGSGIGGSGTVSVETMLVFDDGGGAALYAGGSFGSAGGAAANNIARWNGTSWAPLGGGLSGGAVYALAIFDDLSGSGPALHAAGRFNNPTNRIARWNGTSWQALGSGLGAGVNQWVFALAVLDPGSGPQLFAAGRLSVAGGVSVQNIASWNGSSWSALGSGLTSSVIPEPSVTSLSVWDDGGGPALYAGGQFNRAGGMPAGVIARWDGAGWSGLAGGLGSVSGSAVQAMTVFDDGSSGPQLHLGGNFTIADGLRAFGLALWNGAEWTLPGRSVNDWVYSLTVFDDGLGGGPALYAGGSLDHAGGERVNRIGKWNGSTWAPLGSGVSGSSLPVGLAVLAMEGFDDGFGAGPALYVTGAFSSAGGALATQNLARWDGTDWSSVDGGLNAPGRAFAVFDDGLGGGPALYLGGDFIRAAANHVAKWNGTSWAPLASGTSGPVIALEVFDDQSGSGPALYVAGQFASAGGVPSPGVARWDGVAWSRVRRGLLGPVYDLAVFDDGSGPALFAGGSFKQTGGGTVVNHIAKWNGQTWSALGLGLRSGIRRGAAQALAVYDDGQGLALYAGGDFHDADGLLCRNLARWDGTSWSALGRGVINDSRSAQVLALAVFDDGNGAALHAGGAFTLALDSGDAHLARWKGCLDTTAPVLSCPTSIAIDDPLTSPLGEQVFFSVTATDNRDASPAVVCVPSSGSVFPPGVTRVLCTAMDASGNQATCEFPIFVERRTRRR